MQVCKRILCRERIRKIPVSFSWVDHRLVREGYICRCSHRALALYLFLVTVSDAKGLSYYSDATAGGQLNMPASELESARRELIALDLVAYSRPLYQVLEIRSALAAGSVNLGGMP